MVSQGYYKKIRSATMLLGSLALGGLLSLASTSAQATAAFARSTGAACNKCHSVSFPRLNEKGERFMRNGFQMAGSSEGVTLAGLDGEKASASGEGKKKIADDLFLNQMSEIFAVTGNISLLEKSNDSSKKSVGVPTKLTLLTTGTLAKDMPIWAELEVADGVVEADRYFIGRTNVNDSTLLNVRGGSIDPTTWTSFYGNSAAIDSSVQKVGSYSHDGADHNFTKVGSGYDPRTALEYYGYTDDFMWAAAMANSNNDVVTYPTLNDKKMDYWLVGRMDFLKKSSISLLYFGDKNNDLNMYTLAGNWRVEDFDLRAQYSRDNSKNVDHDNVTGFTFQGDYRIQKGWMAMARFDRTDDGYASDSTEAQLTAALVYAPYQNIKITTAFVKELKKAGSAGVAPVDPKKMNAGSVRLHFML